MRGDPDIELLDSERQEMATWYGPGNSDQLIKFRDSRPSHVSSRDANLLCFVKPVSCPLHRVLLVFHLDGLVTSSSIGEK